jgi:hypothetical protein
MHHSLINNLNHLLLNKTCQHCLHLQKCVGSLKMNVVQEALEGILGSFRWLINLWFILLTPSTLLYVRLTFLHNKLDEAMCLIHVLCRITSMRGLME